MNDALRTPFGEWDKLLLSRAGQIGLGVLAGAITGAIVASQMKLLIILVGAVVGGLLVSLALLQPARAFVALALILALIPTYAAPEVGRLLFIPAGALSWAMAAALMWRNAIERGRPFRPTSLDILVGVFFVLMWISLSYSEQAKSQELTNYLFAWLGPYLAARLLLSEVKRPVIVVAASFAAVTVIVAPFALLETMGVKNVFDALKFNSVEAEAFGNEQLRLGAVRAQASFGHPIALSMWVSVSALLSLAMAIYARTPRERWLWIGLAAVGVGVQVMTFSRTGWLILVLGVFLLALTTAVRAARKRLSWVITISGVAVFALMLSGNAPSALQIIPGSSDGGGTAEEAANFRDSGAYREKLLERALEPGVLGWWGNPYNKVTTAVSSTNTATDNAYIILADTWGLIPTFALFAVAASLLTAIALARRRDAGTLVALPIAALTSLAGLFFVAFITNEQLMIWLLIGAASAASERAIRRSRGQYSPDEDPERPQVTELPPDPEEELQRLAATPVRW